MVDAIISFAVQRLGDHLIREAVLLHGVKDEVVWLRNELDMLRSFLKDAEEKQDDNERIRTWVSQIRDIAYAAEDVIDTFIVKTKRVGTSKTELVSNFIMKCSCVTSTFYLYDIGKKIEALKRRVSDLSRQRDVYGIKNIGEEAQEGTSGKNTRLVRQLRRTTSYAEEEHDVVGFGDDARLLEAKLIQGEPQRSVISIFGMGGLGKTTLARKLYNNDAIKSRFVQHAWVCVSQDWTPRDILERIVKSFKNHSKTELEYIEKMNVDDLERCARKLLEGRRYFVVIDDVWDTAVWETLRRAFPDNKNGSRLIITTRSEAVAGFSGQRTYVHKLPFLQPDESWELFCKKAFPTGETSFAGGMEELGREMVAKCGGLPLAIVVLGGLLSKKESHEWLTVKDHIWRELKNNSLYISALLTLSYNDLPSYLKPCFLYLSLFPEVEFNKERLIRLWIAEGFISQGEETLEVEEVAEEYVKELVGRSLIQVVQGNWRSKIATCRVHDLLRDLVVNKARQLKFLHIYDEDTNFTTTYSRRLAFHSEPKRRSFSIDESDYHVRTLSFLPFSISEEFLSIDQLTRFRLLTVLNLGKLRFFQSGLNAIGKMIHLRYLGFTVSEDLVLPKTLANLQALQTLDLSLSSRSCVEIPEWISKLKCLRHILGDVVVSPKSLRELTNIRTLKFIRLNEFHKELDLRPIGELRNLQVLDIRCYKSECVLSIEPLLNCGHLLDLKVVGNIESLPEEMYKSLPNLKRLSLFDSKLEDDPIPILQMFPNLVFLGLIDIGSPVLEFTSQGFPQLQALIVRGSYQDVSIMDKGAMPKLRAISLPGCRHSFPERLSSLPRADFLNWEIHCDWD